MPRAKIERVHGKPAHVVDVKGRGAFAVGIVHIEWHAGQGAPGGAGIEAHVVGQQVAIVGQVAVQVGLQPRRRFGDVHTGMEATGHQVDNRIARIFTGQRGDAPAQVAHGDYRAGQEGRSGVQPAAGVEQPCRQHGIRTHRGILTLRRFLPPRGQLVAGRKRGLGAQAGDTPCLAPHLAEQGA